MKRFFIMLGAAVAMASSANALELSLTPGSLELQFEKIRHTSDPTLELRGSANVTDLVLLKQIPRAVTTLKMGDLTVEAYTYTDGNYMGATSFVEGELPPYMLMGTNVETLELPKNAKIIGKSAFSATSINRFEVPIGVSRIDDYAFANCSNLREVTIPQSVQLGDGVFKSCQSLTGVEFSNAVSVIPAYTFDGCTAYTASLPEGVASVGDYAYRGTALTDLNLSGVKTIGNYSFSDMPRLATISVDTNAEIQVGKGAFSHDKALTSIPDWDGMISDLVAAHTSGSRNPKINASVIGEAAFANNMDIDSISFGPNLTTVKAHAFRNAKNLTAVTAAELEANIPEVDVTAFSGLEDEEGRYPLPLYVTSDSKSLWEEHPVWGLFNVQVAVTGMVDIHPGNVEIAVSRDGNSLTVISTEVIDSVTVYSLAGLDLQEAAPASSVCTISGIADDGVLMVKVVSGGVTKVVKVM